jgi:thioredoxin-like negative regulator of GroEL
MIEGKRIAMAILVAALVITVFAGVPGWAYGEGEEQSTATGIVPSQDAPAAGVVEVTNDTFRAEVLEAQLPVLVLVYSTAVNAEECAKHVGTMKKLALLYGGAVKMVLAEMNLNANLFGDDYGVHEIPTYIQVRHGEYPILLRWNATRERHVRGFIQELRQPELP